MGVLAVNDHVLKGAGLVPGWVTGKLSDLAGLFFFPLLLTALWDTASFALVRTTRARIDFSLRRAKLALAMAVTLALFVPLKLPGQLSATWIEVYTATLGRVGFPSRVWQDPTDLFALIMLWPAWRLGLAEIRRVPLGRLEVIARTTPPDARGNLADVARLHRDTVAVGELARAYEAHLERPDADSARRASEALRTVRASA